MSREVRSELSQCVQIDRPGSSFYVEVSASLSMIKSLGGVEVIHASKDLVVPIEFI